jgi:hypothetical protein
MVLLWTLAVVASVAWNIVQVRQSAQEQARSSARASIAKDLNYRSLIADLGGVYARVSAPAWSPTPSWLTSRGATSSPRRAPG